MSKLNLRDLEDLLNDQDKKFCKQLVILKGNSYRAALAAGFAESTAKGRSSEWVRKTREDSKKKYCFDYYQLLINNVTNTLDITMEGVLSELKSIAMSKITDVVEIKGGMRMTVKSEKDIPAAALPAIASISKSSYGVVVKFHDKLDALKLLLEYLQLAEDDGSKKGSVVIDKLEFIVKGSKSKLLTNGKIKEK